MGKKNNKTSRNVLTLPQKAFWPLLEESEPKTLLHRELKKALKLAKTLHPQFKRAEVKNLNKDEKVQKVEVFFKNLTCEERKIHEKAKCLKRSLAIGLNEVSRSLEKKELACCLLHGQAKPKMIITHLVDLAKCRMIPIIILNDLKQNLKESLGFSSLAVGLLKEVSVDESHDFHQLCSLIISLSKQLCKEELMTADEECKSAENMETSIKTEGEIHENIDFNSMIIDYTSLHLHRTSSNYRVFHPSSEAADTDEVQETVIITDVPPNSKYDVSFCPVPKKKARYFIEPNILKVQSNPTKFRRKKNKSK